jgi:hypothetical protein
MRGLGEILRNSSNALVKISETPFALRFVGARGTSARYWSDTAGRAYQRSSASAAQRRPSPQATIGAGEAALEFPQTNEARTALNRAADLYFDRRRYGRAASLSDAAARRGGANRRDGAAA